MNLRRMSLRTGDTIYSPGFRAGISRATQILTIHDLIHLKDPVEYSRAKWAYYEFCVKPAVRSAGKVFTVSQTSSVAIREWLGDEVEVIDVGNGCSDSFVEEGRRDNSAKGALLYVGGLHPHKNVSVLAGALRLRPKQRLLVVTSDVAKARTIFRDVQSQVEFRSGVSDEELASLYRGASGLLLPSTVEGFGLTALEAMKCGTPIAYWSGCSSIAEIAKGTGAAVSTAMDAEEWADAFDLLMSERVPDIPDLSRYNWDYVGARVSSELAHHVSC